MCKYNKNVADGHNLKYSKNKHHQQMNEWKRDGSLKIFPYPPTLSLSLSHFPLSRNISQCVTEVQIENPLMNQYLLQAAKWMAVSHHSSKAVWSQARVSQNLHYTNEAPQTHTRLSIKNQRALSNQI